MKRNIFLFLFVISVSAFSQKGPKKIPPSSDTIQTIKIKKKEEAKLIPKLDSSKRKSIENQYSYGQFLIDVTYGYQNVSTSNLEKGIFVPGVSFSSNHTVYSLGLSTDFAGNAGSAAFSWLNFTRINPEKVDASDSSSWTLSGFRMHIFHFGFNMIPRSRYIALIPNIGLEYGRFKLNYEEKNGTKYVYKDPFLVPHFMLDLKCHIFFGRSFMSLGARGGYLYDLGNPRWVGISGGGPQLPGTKMRGYYYSILLCIPLG